MMNLKLNHKDKQDDIQFLRGLAIIAVVMIHTCPDGLWQVYCRPLINFGVPLFIFLSGYLTKEEASDNWNTIRNRRIKKILIPYLIWTLIYTLFSQHRDQIVINLLFGKAAAPLYYSLVYIQLVLLTPVLFKTMKSKWKWGIFIIAPISTIVLNYYFFFSGNELNMYVSYLYCASCLNWIQYYFLGLLIGNNKDPLELKSIKIIIAAYIVSLLMQICEGFVWFKNGSANPGTQFKMSVLLSCTLLIIISSWFIREGYYKGKQKFDYCLKPIIFLGNISYGIYLSHMMILKVLSHLSIYKHLPFVINTAVILAIDILLILLGQRVCNRKLCQWIGLV